MTRIAFGCELHYEVQATTTFLFNVSAARTERQKVVTEQMRLSPQVDMQSFRIGLANNSVQRIRLEPCEFRLTYEGIASLEADVESVENLNEQPYRDIPPEVLPYLNPSRFCESDLLGDFAIAEFGSLLQGYSRVSAVCDWIHRNVRFAGGTTDAHTSARDVLQNRQGVCRDFAHLAIAFCRGLSIPARYVSGYAMELQPPDFHGFFEVYLGERWYLFDATRQAPIGGLVRIATGHDAADVPFATLIGYAELRSKWVWAAPTDGTSILRPPRETGAISTA